MKTARAFLGFFCFLSTLVGLIDARAEDRILLKDDLYQFEMKTMQGTKKIHLDTLGAKEPLPDEITVTLYDSQKTGRTILLQLIKTPNSNSNLPQYQGRLDPSAGSIVGVELKIGLGTNRPPRIIRWKR